MDGYRKITLGVAAMLVAGACGGGGSAAVPRATRDPGPPCVKDEEGGCLKIAPADKRVDLVEPVFSHPTRITNRLHPTATVTSAIYSGSVEGKPFRVEVTLMPGTKTVNSVETLEAQYVAYLDGRVHEVALDRFAQADDGSVWYFGEDVFNYEDGVVADTEGTWKAGRDGPAAMIMPAAPKPGDVYRPENIPGSVFEEVTVKSVGQTVAGPTGPVTGAITVSELHTDGQREEKVFAPGYGEFSTIDPEGDVEPIALAVPTDAVSGPPPTRLAALSAAASKAFDAAARKDWKAVVAERRKLAEAFTPGEAPLRLTTWMGTVIDELSAAATARDLARTRDTAFDAALAGLDLKLRYLPPRQVDQARFELWARRLKADAAAGDPGGVSGDVTVLELIVPRLDPAVARRVGPLVRELRAKANAKDLPGVAAAVPGVVAALGAG